MHFTLYNILEISLVTALTQEAYTKNHRLIPAPGTHLRQLEELPGSLDFLLKVSIGVNCGEMISGNIGSATLTRLDYTVIGDAVNTAQRLQSFATSGQILINEACYEKVKQSFNCERIGATFLKIK